MMNPAAQPLVDLTRRFLAGELSAADYDTRYRATFMTMPVLGDETFESVNALFLACEAYVEDPELRDHKWDVDEAGLREAASKALLELERLGGPPSTPTSTPSPATRPPTR